MDENHTTEQPPTQLWGWREIAAFTHRGRTATFDLVRSPGFPAPIRLGGPTADRLWDADEVRRHVATRRTLPSLPRLPGVAGPGIDADAPLTVAVRPRRRPAPSKSAA